MDALARHWPERMMDGGLLGVFMFVACVGVAAIEHPRSPLRRRLPSPMARRWLMGALMGLTAVALIGSPWGARSGAHMNPAATLAFLSLGKVEPWDAVFYILAQFAGGWLGVRLAARLLGEAAAHPLVRHAVTTPGPAGPGPAWAAEFVMSFVLMTAGLALSRRPGTAPFTGPAIGALLTAFIGLASPISGMSVNPARTLASALHEREFRGVWVYLTAPVAAMILAAAAHSALMGPVAAPCAKWNHSTGAPCIFRCSIDQRRASAANPAPGVGIEPDEGVDGAVTR